MNAFSQVTPRTVGMALILVAATCCGTSDPVSNPNNPPLDGSPWFEENWDYSSTSEMLGQSHLQAYEYGARPFLEKGLTTPWGGTKAFKVPMTPANYGGGIDVYFPRAGKDKPREIWQETYIKFSPNWRTSFPGSGNSDHKTILWFDRDSSVRWSFHIGIYGSGMLVWTTADDTQPRILDPPGQPDLANDVWDGEWHSFRIHFDMGSGSQNDAVIQMWLDGVLYFDGHGLGTLNDSSDYFNKTCLGRNLNKQPTHDQTVWFGRTRVWTSTPDWN